MEFVYWTGYNQLPHLGPIGPSDWRVRRNKDGVLVFSPWFYCRGRTKLWDPETLQCIRYLWPDDEDEPEEAENEAEGRFEDAP